MRLLTTLIVALLCVGRAGAQADHKDLLIKLTNTHAITAFSHMMTQYGGAKVESLGAGNWIRVQLKDQQLKTFNLAQLKASPYVLEVQPNYKLRLLNDYRLKDPVKRAKLIAAARQRALNDDDSQNKARLKDNPDFPTTGSGGNGPDPQFANQWGMNDIGVKEAWKASRGQDMVVAVIDTGVDYTHEDLVDNMWHNNGEVGVDANGKDKSKNGVDDDGNGYVDDVVGYDFAANDNKPYDLAVDGFQLLIGGGNPGHGTHVAGCVAARADNGKGVVGVAPNAKIMALRFLSEKGEGSTAGAVQAIDYAIKNGAKILSNSWGSEGEDSESPEENKALREAIQRAEAAGVLFIAAAGNGHQGVGYDNDNDPQPAIPASYDDEIIVSVAAVDVNDALGSFSNWGARSVDLAAPGVKVLSTTVGSNYSDTVFDMFGLTVTWDGTSMATPHVSGAAALYWSQHPNATWRDVKAALLNSAEKVQGLSGKMTSGGKLNVESLMKF